MNKFFCLAITAAFILLSFSAFAEETENIGGDITGTQIASNIWKNECDSLENVAELNNIAIWEVEDDELETMYGDTHILRREPNTNEAWIVYEIPYVKSVSFITYVWPAHEGEVEVLLSKNGTEWVNGDFDITRIAAPDEMQCWTKLLYEKDDINGVKYIKLIWPETDAVHNDWWNPYMGWIEAETGQPVPVSVEIDVPLELVIPRYENSVYELNAKVIDQLDAEITAEITWSIKEPIPNGISLTDNKLTVDKTCEDNSVIELTVAAVVEEKEISSSVNVIFKNAVAGDVNLDMKIDKSDLDFVVENYGKTNKDSDWMEVRLADIDENGLIDIIDMSYIGFFVK